MPPQSLSSNTGLPHLTLPHHRPYGPITCCNKSKMVVVIAMKNTESSFFRSNQMHKSFDWSSVNTSWCWSIKEEFSTDSLLCT